MALDYTGLRPAFKREVTVIERQLEVTVTNLERKLLRAGLTRRECAVYRGLVKSLGIHPKPC